MKWVKNKWVWVAGLGVLAWWLISERNAEAQPASTAPSDPVKDKKAAASDKKAVKSPTRTSPAGGRKPGGPDPDLLGYPFAGSLQAAGEKGAVEGLLSDELDEQE